VCWLAERGEAWKGSRVHCACVKIGASCVACPAASRERVQHSTHLGLCRCQPCLGELIHHRSVLAPWRRAVPLATTATSLVFCAGDEASAAAAAAELPGGC
jgi:hypothetical protein